MDRVTALLIEQLGSLAEGRSVLLVGITEEEAREKARMIVCAAKALRIRVRGKTYDQDAPAVRYRAFDEPPYGRKDVFHGAILPSAVFERGNVREDAVRRVTA